MFLCSHLLKFLERLALFWYQRLQFHLFRVSML